MHSITAVLKNVNVVDLFGGTISRPGQQAGGGSGGGGGGESGLGGEAAGEWRRGYVTTMLSDVLFGLSAGGGRAGTFGD